MPRWWIFGMVFCVGMPLFVVLGGVRAQDSPLFPVRVVVSEVMWAGSDLSTADEWVELAGISVGTGGAVPTNLSGWTLTYKNSAGIEETIVRFGSGMIVGSGEYIVVSNYSEPESRLGIVPTVVTTAVTLPNTKLFLRIRNSSGTIVDEVDDWVGAPFAGLNPSGTGSKASMERVSLTGSGMLKANWRTAATFRGFDDGARLFGTPGFLNGTGPSTDTFSPVEASAFSAYTKSGSLIVSWKPSISLDLAMQILEFTPLLISGSSSIVLPKTATGFTTGAIVLGSGYTLKLRSMDDRGNTSSRVITLAEPFPDVRITEVLANPIGEDTEEWIEVGNLGARPVDIAGWVLDEGNSPGLFTIPSRSSSGFVLAPGEHVSFRKSLTGLPLGNEGEEVSLKKGVLLIDSWNYPETAEEVSYGRDPGDSKLLRSFCVPSEGRVNTGALLDPQIIIQSGQTRVHGKVTLNLEAQVASGSLASASCSWDFRDGFFSPSCNPPSHTFTQVGLYSVRLEVLTFCGERMVRTLEVEVLPQERVDTVIGDRDVSSGGGRGSGSPGREEYLDVCVPSAFTGVLISEFVPRPREESIDISINQLIDGTAPVEGEWIELQNVTDHFVSLCGWFLDDEEGGGRPFRLDGLEISADDFLVLSEKETKIGLNNDGDSVRLIVGEGIFEVISYDKAVGGESFARRDDGVFLWTPFLTPGTRNQFRSVAKKFEKMRVVISRVMPNPKGKDRGGDSPPLLRSFGGAGPTSLEWSLSRAKSRDGAEWVELRSLEDVPVSLDGWGLRSGKRGKIFVFTGVTLEPGRARKFNVQETGLNLVNTADSVQLFDPDENLVSIVSWEKAKEGRVYKPYVFSGERVHANVLRVIDGDTIEVVFLNSVLTTNYSLQPTKVRLLGIDAPETVHPSTRQLRQAQLPRSGQVPFTEEYGEESTIFLRSLLEGKEVALEVEGGDAYGRTLASVFLDGRDVQRELLSSGFAIVEVRFPFLRMAEYLVYEEEARRARVGVWSEREMEGVVLKEREILAREGAKVSKGAKGNKGNKGAKGIKVTKGSKGNTGKAKRSDGELRVMVSLSNHEPYVARGSFSKGPPLQVRYRNVVAGDEIQKSKPVDEVTDPEMLPKVYQKLLALAVEPGSGSTNSVSELQGGGMQESEVWTMVFISGIGVLLVFMGRGGVLQK